MDQFTLPNHIYYLVVDSAISLFLALYIMLLVNQTRNARAVQPVSLPLWLNLMYPRWLDKLTFRQIVIAFAWGLGISIISWIVLAVALVAVLARVYGS
jgi:hypothetical protein